MDKLFFNGVILTMEPERTTEAVLVCGGKIAGTGSLEALRAASPGAAEIDLGGRTMMPAFIDAHGHFFSYANTLLQVQLGGAADFAGIEERVTSFVRDNGIPAGDWIVAAGYDHNFLEEKRHPDRELLDRIAPGHPLLLQHQSGHCGVLNTRALDLLGIAGKPSGYLEETEYIQCVKRVPPAGAQALAGAVDRAAQRYFSYGITTAQDGMLVAQMLPLYQILLEREVLTLDVVGYPDLQSMEEFAKAFPSSVERYDRHFRLGGCKIVLDGSPQLRTAWMQSPYEGGGNDCGYGTMSDSDVLAAVERAAGEGFQLLAHCNGDAAIQQFIDAVKKTAAQNARITELKPVIIHAQLMTKRQLEEASELGMIPSFFVAHVFHWGDIHVKNFGLARAKTISPARSALERGLAFTFHQDAPVIEPDMLETIQCAVTRKTKTGVTLGEEERISVPDALRAVTLNAARQYSEEDRKGSIREGKQADLVILSDNPLTVPQGRIREIAVLETIKDGETVFRRSGNAVRP